MSKTHWKKLENPDFIGAYTLEEGKDFIVTIDIVKRTMVTGIGGKKEECTVAYLKGQKPFILNRTNMKTISKIYGTPYIEDWAGKQITLYVARVKAFGEDDVEALRVRPEKPATKNPELLPTDTVNWAKVVTALQNGYTIDQVKAKWSISEANQTKLMEEAI